MKRKTARELRKTGHMLPDKYDLIRDHLINGTELEDAQLIKLCNAARLIYPLMVEEITTKSIVERLVGENICGPGQAYKMIRETEKIYGRVRQNSQDGLRAILVENALQALKDARDEKDYRGVAGLIDKIAKLEGLYTEQGKVQEVYQQLTLMPIQVTADPQVIEMESIDLAELE